MRNVTVYVGRLRLIFFNLGCTSTNYKLAIEIILALLLIVFFIKCMHTLELCYHKVLMLSHEGLFLLAYLTNSKSP